MRLDNTICAKCSYDLTGLPLEGRCPECGHPFDRQRGLGVKVMPTAEERGDRLMKIIRTVALTLATLFVMLITVVLWAIGYPKVIGIGLITSLILGLAAITSYLSLREIR